MKPVINDSEIADMYTSVDPAGKIMLQRLFGKKSFSVNLWNDIKSFEDGLQFEGLNPEDVLSILPSRHKGTTREISRHALDKIEFLRDIFCEGWEPDWTNPNEYKYIPYFISSGSGLSFLGTVFDRSRADVASRLYFPTREMAEKFGKQFLPYYIEWILGKSMAA